MTWEVGSGASSNDSKKAWCPWCCYITVDFSTAASQNVFGTYKLSLQKKNNIKKIRKNIIFLCFFFYPGAFVKLNHYVTHNYVLWLQPSQNPPLCSSTMFFLIVVPWHPSCRNRVGGGGRKGGSCLSVCQSILHSSWLCPDSPPLPHPLSPTPSSTLPLPCSMAPLFSAQSKPG